MSCRASPCVRQSFRVVAHPSSCTSTSRTVKQITSRRRQPPFEIFQLVPKLASQSRAPQSSSRVATAQGCRLSCKSTSSSSHSFIWQERASEAVWACHSTAVTLPHSLSSSLVSSSQSRSFSQRHDLEPPFANEA
ncbi:hypothetical protein MRB53_039875 [Persea americana]|nr:hypothetical protein MRB53_039875 [Persea americana]